MTDQRLRAGEAVDSGQGSPSPYHSDTSSKRLVKRSRAWNVDNSVITGETVAGITGETVARDW